MAGWGRWMDVMDGCMGGVSDEGDGEGYDDYGDYEDDCCENNISILVAAVLLFVRANSK